MKAQIEVQMDNAAFERMPGDELARILREVARRVEHDSLHLHAAVRHEYNLFDVNGNKVGFLVVTK